MEVKSRVPGKMIEVKVAVGDTVAEKDVLGVMEAMKMISEVSAPCDCIITDILKTNGEMAQFGEGLFRYEPC